MSTLLLVGLVAVPTGAEAAETVDQQQPTQTAPYGLSNTLSRAQTFTAGLSGLLTRVDLAIGRAADATAPVVVEIRNVSDGKPGATILASTQVPAADLAVWAGGVVPLEPITFTAPATVLAGTQYAVVIHTNGLAGNYVMGATMGNPYAAGAALTAASSPPAPADWALIGPVDHAFRTYVDAFDPACDANGVRTGYNTIKGTPGADELVGTTGRDLIYGFGGNDVIKGRGGSDLICAGDGNDLVVAGNRADVVFGGDGNDRLRGGAGNDRLRGGNGNDVIAGGDGRDRLYGNGGSDILRGNDGRDRLYGGTGRDTLRGGAGTDFLSGGPARDDVRG